MTESDLWLSLDRLGFQVAEGLFSLLWQSSILIGAAAIGAHLLRRRRAAVRHALWAAAVLATPLLPLLGRMVSSFEAPRAQIEVLPVYSGPTPVIQTVAADAVPAAPVPGATVSPRAGDSPESPSHVGLPSYPWALGLLAYALGAGAFVALVLLGAFRIGRWIRQGKIVTEPAILERFRASRKRLNLKRDVVVVENPEVRGPLTVGILRPLVLLPEGLASGLSEAELEALSIHELAHAVRREPLVLTILSFVRALLFLHPLIWVACRQIAALAERACDEAVLDVTKQPVPYAKMLTRFTEELPRRALSMELASGILLSRKNFLRRIEAILSDRSRNILTLSRLAIATTALGAMGTLSLALALPLTRPPQESTGGSDEKQPAGRASNPGLADEAPTAARDEKGLQLSIEIEPATITVGEPLRLTARLENLGDQPIEIFKPHHYEIISHSNWRIRAAVGIEFLPYRTPFQSTRGSGMLGELVTLAPKQRRSMQIVVPLFQTKIPFTRHLSDPRPLSPGKYSVSCFYEKPDNLVPFARESAPFGTERRPVDGLWTGSLKSKEVSLTVLPSGKPSLTINARPNPSEGDAYPLHIAVENPGKEPVSFRGAFVLKLVAGKAAVGMNIAHHARARFRPGPPVEILLHSGRTFVLDLAARSKQTFTVDLTHLRFIPDGRDASYAMGFYSSWLAGGRQLSLVFEDEAGSAVLESNRIVRIVRARKVDAIPGLRLDAVTRPNDHSVWPLLEVALINDRPDPVRISSRLAFPTDVSFDLRDPKSKRNRELNTAPHSRHSPEATSAVPKGLSWRSSAFERPRPLTRHNFRMLPPGGALRRTFDLSYLLGGTAAPGRYELRAYWRGFESARRFGLDDPPAIIGAVVSQTIIIEVPATSPPEPEDSNPRR